MLPLDHCNTVIFVEILLLLYIVYIYMYVCYVLQRRDYSALVKFLPPKHEYVISVRLSSLQISLYQQYLDNFTSASSLISEDPAAKFQCAGLFSDYHSLMHIWTHPYVLRLDEIRQEKKVPSFLLCTAVLSVFVALIFGF